MLHLYQVGAQQFQDLAGWVAQALSVDQVAGVLIGNPPVDFLLWRLDPKLRQVFGHIFYLAGELARPDGKLRIVLQQLAILFHGRTASGGVGHNGVKLAVEHHAYVVARQLAGLLAEAGVSVQRPAASLLTGNEDAHAVLLQHAYGGAIQFGEGHAGDASREEGNPSSRHTDGGKRLPKFLKVKVLVEFWRQLFYVGQSQQLHDAARPCKLLQS